MRQVIIHDDHLRSGRRDSMMDVAQIIGGRGTCDRLRVGAVIARDSRIVSTGYNGNVTNAYHCDHKGDDRPCETAVHAEANAIAYAARHGVAIEGCELYVTHEPCINCAKIIANSGIVMVFYETPYRLHDGLALLESAKVGVARLWPSMSR